MRSRARRYLADVGGRKGRYDNRVVHLLYSYNSYVLQIVDVARLSFCVELTGLFTWPGFYSQLASKVIHTGSVRIGCLSSSPRGVILNTSCHRIFYACVITKLHQVIDSQGFPVDALYNFSVKAVLERNEEGV